MSFLVNLLLGLLFGIGLVVSGMSDPAKVLNFLDVFGNWDPSLAFVMAGAVLVAFTGYRFVMKLDRPVLAVTFHLPTKTGFDKRLVAGAAIFGVGWPRGFLPWPGIDRARARHAGRAGFPAGHVCRHLGGARAAGGSRACARGVTPQCSSPSSSN